MTDSNISIGTYDSKNYLSQLIGAGFALIPVRPGRKGPVDAGWNEPGNAITDPEALSVLFGKNVGVALANCSPPLCTLDIDDLEQAAPILAKLGVDLAGLLKAHDAVWICSGKVNHAKLLYRIPNDWNLMQSVVVKGSNSRVAFELRCADARGKTMQDLIPPSVHPSGTQYQWGGDGNPLHPPQIPGQLLSAWNVLRRTKATCTTNSHRAKKNRSRGRFETPHEVACIRKLLNHIDPDCDYGTWRDVVWALLSLQWSCSEDLALEWSMKAPHRFSISTFQTLVRSHCVDRGGPSVRTLEYYARKGPSHG